MFWGMREKSNILTERQGHCERPRPLQAGNGATLKLTPYAVAFWLESVPMTYLCSATKEYKRTRTDQGGNTPSLVELSASLCLKLEGKRCFCDFEAAPYRAPLWSQDVRYQVAARPASHNLVRSHGYH